MAVSLRPVDLARAAGMHQQSVRKYERWGFLPPAERAPNGYRMYGERHLVALLCARSLIAGYGWKKALQVMRLANRGAASEALALADEIHATVHKERRSAEETLKMLARLAGGTNETTPVVRPGPPGARRELYVGEVARAVGVEPSAVRFWEEQGLITPRRDGESSYRLYSADDVYRVQLIHTLRQAHYSFGSIQSVLDGLKAGQPEQARAAAQKRLQQLAASSVRCAAATAALYAYLRDHGEGLGALTDPDLDDVTDWYGRTLS